ncbi:LapA family protein [Microvirga terrae]|uniref:LapA family protein n=1 Tax=Microvirga terrae TaxID=2740529 RepID=A0ABY5RR97_9HYPH|nr:MULTISPECIES: LapA family protein [Microvirga]MBQ0821319.1 LapA family protein [Microvirga sp. HBU67558]UVF19558.1 LapA family protein [Microvirga terrae]
MIRFLKALILLPVAILVVLLAVANRAPVTLSLDPFSQEAPEFATQLPLFAVIFAAVMLGVVIGGTASWLAQGKNRRKGRQSRREARQLRYETERLKSQGASGNTLPATVSSSPSPRF